MKVLIYNWLKYILCFIVSLLYYNLFFWGNSIISIIMFFLFLYCCAYPLSEIIVSLAFYIFSKPKLLKSEKDIFSGKIPKDVNVIFLRPIFAKTFEEMKNLLDCMKQDINSLKDLKNFKFIVIDNTRDQEVKEKTKSEIIKMQEEFGKDIVFYFHRNPKCDFFKKVGIIFDAILFICEGKTRPDVYVSEKWKDFTSGLRNPNEPLWDIILGDIVALGIDAKIEDVLSGKDVKIDPNKTPKICFLSDADNVWHREELLKIIAKILHQENKYITIFQPMVVVSNMEESGFTKLHHIAREITRYDVVVKWRIYNFQPFYGKGAVNLENYIRNVIRKECLHPAKAASHDFQESLYAETALLEDVYVLEKTFPNKVAELRRIALWQWGDLETVRQYLFKKFSKGRKAHIYTLLRILTTNTFFNLWLILTIFGFSFGKIFSIKNFVDFWKFFLILVALRIFLANFVVPAVTLYKNKKYPIRPNVLKWNIFTGVYFTIVTTLLNNLDLIYQPISFIKNFILQIRNKPFVWKTAAMAELETSRMSLFEIYKNLFLSPLISLVIIFLFLLRIINDTSIIFVSPYLLSFLFGPLVIYILSRKK